MKKKLLIIHNFLLIQLLTLTYSNAGNVTTANLKDYSSLTNALNKYAGWLAILISALALAAFVFNVILLGTAGSNASKREDAIKGMFMSGAVAAFLPMTVSIVQLILSI